MNFLTINEMMKYFEDINQHLALEDKTGVIFVVGGAALALAFGARDSTQDIDAVFQPQEIMRRIIDKVAQKNNLSSNWLNDFVRPYVPERIEFNIFKEYSHLTVSNANAESLLAMKLVSARFGTKDMSDCVFLMKHLNIQNENELFNTMDKYINPFLRKKHVNYFALEAYKQYKEDK